MKTPIAFGLAMVTVAGFGSLARAEQLPASQSVAPVSLPPAVAVGTEPSAQTVPDEPPQVAQATPQSEAATPSLTASADQAPQAAGRASSAQSAPPEASSPPKDTKTTKPKAPWGHLEPCRSPDLEDGTDLSTDCSGIFGLRASITRLSGVTPDDAIGLTVSTEGEQYVRRGIWTARTLHRLGIGGGAAGFEGTLLGGWAGGVRLPVAPCRRHGPVLRLGMYGYLRGNDAFYGSLLELPQLQLGYQYMHGKILVELGATTGAVLVGRSRTGDSARRVLGAGFERGGYAAIQFPWLRLGMSGSRLPANDSLSVPVDVFEGTLCVRIHGFAICSDARATTTDAVVEPGAKASEVRSLYAGLSIGFTRE